MKKLIFILFVFQLVVACEKSDTKVRVQYTVSDAYAITDITFRGENSELVKETLNFESPEDVWNYSFEQEEGEIVYLSAVYYDSASSVRLQIMVDGKVFKQESSTNEPQKYLTVSGTIPFN